MWSVCKVGENKKRELWHLCLSCQVVPTPFIGPPPLGHRQPISPVAGQHEFAGLREIMDFASVGRLGCFKFLRLPLHFPFVIYKKKTRKLKPSAWRRKRLGRQYHPPEEAEARGEDEAGRSLLPRRKPLSPTARTPEVKAADELQRKESPSMPTSAGDNACRLICKSSNGGSCSICRDIL